VEDSRQRRRSLVHPIAVAGPLDTTLSLLLVVEVDDRGEVLSEVGNSL